MLTDRTDSNTFGFTVIVKTTDSFENSFGDEFYL